MNYKPRTICIYGDSGVSKSSQTYNLAKYIHAKTGLKGRFIGFNASDIAPFQDSGMIEEGIIDYFDCSNPKYALAYMRWLGEGYWPQDLQDEETGKITLKAYFKKDKHCETDFEKEQIGFYIFEGLVGCANALLGHAANQQEKVGFTQPYKVEEEGEYIGGTDQGHYGLVQKELYKLVVQGLATLPIKYLIVTSLVSKGQDRAKESIYGPKSAGNAQAFEIPSWFQDCFHIERVERDGEEKTIAWFEKHRDVDTNIPYLAKLRTMPEVYRSVKHALCPTDPIGGTGYIELDYTKGLARVYEVMEKVNEQWKKTTQKKKLENIEKVS